MAEKEQSITTAAWAAVSISPRSQLIPSAMLTPAVISLCTRAVNVSQGSMVLLLEHHEIPDFPARNPLLH